MAGNFGSRLYMPLLRLLHRFYKLFISPLFGDVCRFYPYCSDYALEAIRRHGLVRGSFLAIRRVIRCNPWVEGGQDPVPDYFWGHYAEPNESPESDEVTEPDQFTEQVSGSCLCGSKKVDDGSGDHKERD